MACTINDIPAVGGGGGGADYDAVLTTPLWDSHLKNPNLTYHRRVAEGEQKGLDAELATAFLAQVVQQQKSSNIKSMPNLWWPDRTEGDCIDVLQKICQRLEAILHQDPVFFCVTGNIGAGKTTGIDAVAPRLAKHWPRLAVIHENHPVWQHLGIFYQNPKKHAANLQFEIIDCMVYALYCAVVERQARIVIMDRSLRCAVTIFASLAFEQGNLTSAEKRFFDFFFEHFGGELHGYVQVVAPPSLCHARALQRARVVEQHGVSLPYLEALGKAFGQDLQDLAEGKKYHKAVPFYTGTVCANRFRSKDAVAKDLQEQLQKCLDAVKEGQ